MNTVCFQGSGGRHPISLVFERRRVAAASRRGTQAENVDLRPTPAVPAAARAKTSLKGVRPRFLPGFRQEESAVDSNISALQEIADRDRFNHKRMVLAGNREPVFIIDWGEECVIQPHGRNHEGPKQITRE